MKKPLFLLALLVNLTVFAQSYTYKPSVTPVYQPSTLLENPNTSTKKPPTSNNEYQRTNAPVAQSPNTILITNVWREAKTIELYVQNAGTFEWEFLKSVRIPDGQSFSLPIGANEHYYKYGYVVVGSLIKTISAFSSSSLSIF